MWRRCRARDASRCRRTSYRACCLGMGADTARLYPSPRGRKLDHTFIRSLAQKKNVLFVCGRYEGLDERVIDHYQLEEVSVGDYVLSGGEIAALTIIDAIVRVLDGVMGKAEGHEQDSFEKQAVRTSTIYDSAKLAGQRSSPCFAVRTSCTNIILEAGNGKTDHTRKATRFVEAFKAKQNKIYNEKY